MKCPTCHSRAPHLHPAVQSEGEVSVCSDLFHRQVTPENTHERIDSVGPDEAQKILVRIASGLLLMMAIALPCFADGNDCKVAKDAKTEIGKACVEGGVKRAKAVMKAMTKEAKKAGMKIACDDCHKDEDTWELNPDAKDKYKEMATKIVAR